MRKNQATLTAAEKTAFVNAVLAVKRKPSILHPEDRSFSRYDDFVEIHLNAMMVMMNNQPSWAHQGPVFGPWHRVMLRQFELELQQIDAQVEMPYWDWTRGNSRSRTSSLWQNDFLGPDGRTSGLQSGKVMSGPFAFDAGNWLIRVKDQPRDPDYLIRRLGRTPDARTLPTATMVNAALVARPYDTAPWEDSLRDPNDSVEWQGFRIQLEIPLHNLVHRWVGGNMVDMTSPNDPVFWLHHCNIDRLWAEWLVRHRDDDPYLPEDGAPTGQNLNEPMIFNLPGERAPWRDRFTPADVLDHHIMGVRYDTEGVERMAREIKPAKRERRSLPMFVLPGEIPALSNKKPVKRAGKPKSRAKPSGRERPKQKARIKRS
jgi:tyrosinase